MPTSQKTLSGDYPLPPSTQLRYTVSMRKTAFTILDALPAKALSGFWGAATLYATARPDDASARIDAVMSAASIQLWGAIGFAVFVIYWALWFWLKPKDDTAFTAQATHGAGSHAIGSIGTAHFNNNAAPEPALRTAAASQTVEILRAIETKYCRKGYMGLLESLQLYETFQKNVIIVVGMKLGSGYIDKEVYEEANDFFEGGGSILTTKMENFTDGPMRELKLPPHEVIHVNFTKRAGEVQSELADLALSPFLPPDVCESLTQLEKAVGRMFKEMIVFLNERFQNQRVRLIVAANDPLVASGLCNDFLDRALALDEPISHLREAIRRSLINGLPARPL